MASCTAELSSHARPRRRRCAAPLGTCARASVRSCRRPRGRADAMTLWTLHHAGASPHRFGKAPCTHIPRQSEVVVLFPDARRADDQVLAARPRMIGRGMAAVWAEVHQLFRRRLRSIALAGPIMERRRSAGRHRGRCDFRPTLRPPIDVPRPKSPEPTGNGHKRTIGR